MTHYPPLQKTRTHHLYFLMFSLVLTLFLCYIDESAYSLKGLLEPENWPSLLVYTGIFYGLQLFVAKVILRRYTGAYTVLFSILGVLAILTIFMCVALLIYLF